MKNKPWQISRRTMLKGVGVSMALPFLEAMAPLAGRAAGPATKSFPVRMAVLYMANGVHPEAWTPKGTGGDFELSPILEPLAKVKNQLLVFSELMNAGSIVGDGHHVKT